MKRSSPPPPAVPGRPDRRRDALRAEGERLVAWYRMLAAGFVLAFIPIYWLVVAPALRPAMVACAAIAVAWAGVSAFALWIDRRGLTRSWHPYVAIGLDLAAVTAMQWAISEARPLHFTHGPVTGLYFVVIGLAALRGSRHLAVLAGSAAAAVHVLFSAILFGRILAETNVVAQLNGYAMGINFLDEVGKGLGMATVGVVIGFVTDSLRTSERRYLHLFDHIPGGTLIVDDEGRIRIANQRLADMLGVTRDSLAGRPAGSILVRGPSDPERASLLVRSDGSAVPVRTASQPVEYWGSPCREISVQDVTEQVRLERQLSRSQRMETVGQLAGGLTHDFNNLLGGIIGAASLSARVLGRVDDPGRRERLAARIELIRERGEAARGLVGRLLAFTRRSQIESARIDLARIVRECAEICRNTFRKDIDIVVDLAAAEAPVDGDAGALTQAVLNLCINAQDAMPDGGTLTLRLAEAVADEVTGTSGEGIDSTEGAWLIEVRDTGVGMDPATVGRIFDPFFSTKRDGVGTGLGLSMVESTAREHGGHVRVDSAPGRGSSFKLALARSRISLLPDAPAADLPRGTGRILFVDDDDLVRATVTGMLTELGYEVIAAAGGEEAIRLFDAHAGDFDLLLLDLMMPGLDGIQTLERIRAKGGPVPAMIATGFWTAERDAEIEELGVAAILTKPFPISTLAREVARILGAAGGVR